MGMPTNEYPGYGAPVADFNNLQQQSPNQGSAAALGGMPAQGRDQEGEPMEFDDQHHLSRNRELSGDMMVDAPEVDESSDEEAENRPPGHLEEKSPAPGDEVDLGNIASFYMGMKLDVQDSVGKWSEAEVIGVDVTHSCVEITYLYWADKWNEWIRIDSGRLAAANTQVYVPGGPLRVGMRVEVLDERLQWLEAEVMEVSPCRTEAKVHFRGWKPAFDEWVPRVPGVGSGKVRPYGRGKAVAQRKARYGAAAANAAGPGAHQRVLQAASDQFQRYQAALAARGLRLHPVEGDGNCLFRAVAHQVYGDDAAHLAAREGAADYMLEEAAYFEPYVEGGPDDFLRYLEAKRRPGTWGDDPEVQALCEIYDRPAEIWVFCPREGARKLRTFHEPPPPEAGAAGAPAAAAAPGGPPPMRLSYYGGGHYDSIVPAPGGPADPADPAGSTNNVLLESAPGVAEEAAVARARRRKLLALGAGGPGAAGGVEGARQRSDEEATERAALEAALQASRLEFDRGAEHSGQALEAALEASLQQLVLEQGAGAGGGAAGAGAEGGDEGLRAAQAALLRSAAAASEEEELQRALAASAASEEEAALRQALAASQFQEGEDPELAAALAASLGGGEGGGGEGGVPGGGGEVADPELAAALAASMAGGGGGAGPGGGGGEGLGLGLAGGLLSEEEQLRIAMEESLYN